MLTTTTITPSFPIALSSSLISAYKQCPMKFYYEYCLNRVPRNDSVHLVAGGAYAKAQEVFRKLYYGGLQDEDGAKIKAIIELTKDYGNLEPVNSYKTWDRTVQAFLSYYDYWKPSTDVMQPAMLNGEPSVEYSFAQPLDIMHPETGDPILFAGKLDAIMDMGGLFVFDDKTTGAIGPMWGNQWDLRSQFTGYVWGAKKSGINVKGAIVRGCAIQKAQIKFNQAITYRPTWQIERWYEGLMHTVERLVKDWNDGYFEYNLGDACQAFGDCSFKASCETKDPEAWFKTLYMTRTWEPLRVESL